MQCHCDRFMINLEIVFYTLLCRIQVIDSANHCKSIFSRYQPRNNTTLMTFLLSGLTLVNYVIIIIQPCNIFVKRLILQI